MQAGTKLDISSTGGLIFSDQWHRRYVRVPTDHTKHCDVTAPPANGRAMEHNGVSPKICKQYVKAMSKADC